MFQVDSQFRRFLYGRKREYSLYVLLVYVFHHHWSIF